MPESHALGNRRDSIDLSGALKWRCIGPHRGGRVVAVAGHPERSMVFFFGACAGGVWKTTDGGTYWENVSDGFFGTAAVGAIHIAESDPNVIYVGTGETAIRGNVSHGDGMYRSTDGGRNWRHLGLADTRHIAKVRVHPGDPDLVYVAALGHAWGPNEERGVYRSCDGGETWEKILFRSDRAGAIDLSMDANNPRILYASLWEAQRTPYSLSSGGPGSVLFRSTDGGDSWTELTDRPGLPTGIKGKIGVATSPAREGRVWALVEAEDGALFRSDDGGETWTRLCEELDLRRRAWYYTHLYADPQDPETCWVLNLQCWKSTDGGATFSALPTPHGDNHDLWIDPGNPQRMIEGNDGGACVTFNGGASWSTIYNQPTAQFYHVTADTQIPYRVYGSQQDNSALSLPSRSIGGAITAADWYMPGGGESGYIAVRPDDSNVVFAGAIGSGFGNGLLTRYDHRTGQARNITVWPDVLGMSDGANQLKYRFQWTFPILLSPHDPNVLYVAANQVFRSTDEGESWQVISPDLSRNDPATLEPSGGPLTKDNTGAEVYGTIFALVESPHQQGLFWAGSDDGLVHLSRDGGETWENITPPDLPEWALIGMIELSPHDPASAYLAATRYKHDDLRPFLYHTNDYGKTWRLIVDGIPDHEFTRVIRADPARRGLLYAGTETGVYVSFDDGTRWEPMQGNLPVVPIYDLLIKDYNLVVATHGRSFWILDDLTPLHQLAERRDPAATRLFKPAPTVRFLTYQGFGSPGGSDVSYRHAGAVGVSYRLQNEPDGTKKEVFLDAGENPPFAVVVNYYLAEEPEGIVTLSFLDAEGQEIRQFSSKSKPKEPPADAPPEPLAEAAAEGEEALETEPAVPEQEPRVATEVGINRFVWNLRYPDARKIPGVKSLDWLVSGPVVPPGRYQVRLSVADESYTETFELLKDPRVAASDDDLRAQFDFNLRVHTTLTKLHDAVIQIRDVKQQLDGWQERLKGSDTAALRAAARQAAQRLSAIEEELIQVKAEGPRDDSAKLNFKLAVLPFITASADARPTQQVYAVYDDVSGRIEAQLAALREVIDTEIAAFNLAARDAEVPAVVLTVPADAAGG